MAVQSHHVGCWGINGSAWDAARSPSLTMDIGDELRRI